ncbi:MAG: hypothetical protein RMA76_34105 [Deltaproteobacteria bacterium]|jgi:hypothetical protein
MNRTLVIALSLAIATPALAAGEDGDAKKVVKKPGTVLTFYGLRKLEQDPEVSDEEKLREWKAFIDRAQEQIGYAKRAMDRWKNAARLRVVDAATRADSDDDLSPRDKITKWTEVRDLYPKSKEARKAKQRVAHWTSMETKRLVAEAEGVERARKPKVDRIRAWEQVLTWVAKGPEARAALKRINDLQKQLYTEAMSVDKIARIDRQTKLEAWNDVLAGRPSPDQAKKAKQRVAELESEMVQTNTMKKSGESGM